MKMTKINIMICIALAAGCAQQKPTSAPSFQCVPEVVQTHEVGGTLIGPDGGMYDGDKYGQELRISDGSQTYVYDWLIPPCEFEKGKRYAFCLNLTNHQIEAIQNLSGRILWANTNTILSPSRSLLRVGKRNVEPEK